jgi:type I restriction enzyme, S subunit
MKSYPEYKDSGVEWIGEIPDEWDLSKLGYLSYMIVPMRDKPKVLKGEIPWLRIEDFDDKYVSTSKSKQGVTQEIIDKMNLKVFPIETVLCSCSCHMGKTAIVKKPLVTNQTFIGIVPGEELISLYLYYFMLASTNYLNAISTGAIQTYLSRENFEKIKIPLFSYKNQQQIANYLDHKIAKIDILIGKKKKLIDLLKEERIAVINEAVTKGLDPDVRMKDSGIEWLGKIPEHWIKNVKLTQLVTNTHGSFVNGPFGSDLLTSEINKTDGVPVIYIRDIRNGYFERKNIAFVSKQKAEQLNVCRVTPDDLLVAKVGDPPGISAVYPKKESDAIITQDVIRMRLNQNKVVTHFLSYLLNSKYGVTLINTISVESTRTRVGLGDFKNLKILLPPLEEQTDIVNFIKTETTRIDTIISKSKKEIELLKEYRTALISEVVTGKIDVRDWKEPEK